MAFELVQRLRNAPDGKPYNVMGDPASIKVAKFLLDAGAGVDLDYMGSSEYSDPRTLLGSANRIATSAHRLNIVTRQLVRPSYTEDVRFICSEQEGALLSDWDDWTKDPHTKEPSGYFRNGTGSHDDIVGWWALEEDLIWTREQETAENIRDAFVTIATNAAA